MTGSSMCTEALPVRSPDNSVFKTAPAPCMRRLMSLISCVSFAMAIPRTRSRYLTGADRLANHGRAAFATQNGLDCALVGDREHNDRHPVFPGKREGGRIHHPQVFLDCFLVAELVVTLGFGVLLGIG